MVSSGGRHLVVQGVTRSDSGDYACAAHNVEGDDVSQIVKMDVKCEFWPFILFSRILLGEMTASGFVCSGKNAEYRVVRYNCIVQQQQPVLTAVSPYKLHVVLYLSAKGRN